MESEKREEELRMQKRYNEDKLIEEIKCQMCKKLEQKIQTKQKMINQTERTWILMRSGQKFKGIFLDWAQFWNQFEAEIDTANIPQIIKFSYLKEMLHPYVGSSIDSLPFSSERYERAKNILKSKYGKSSGVINALVQKIMGSQCSQ